MNEQPNKPTRRPRGTGRLYLQNHSPKWMVQYYRNGTIHRESSGTADRRKAEKFLQKRLAEVSTGNFIGPRIERITVAELIDDLFRKYGTGEIEGKKSLAWSERRWNKHLKPFFGDVRAVQVGTDMLSRYVEERQKAGASNASINRELALLRRAFQIGFEANPRKVAQVPPIPRLEENNVRKGFLTDEQYDRLAKECAAEGLWLRAMLAVAYNFGWRKGELRLRVEQVNLLERTIRLEVGTTKNGEGRIVNMTDEVYELLKFCVQGKQPQDFVFTRADGKPVKDFRGAWRNACERAEVPNLLVHDLRRSAARNLRREGESSDVIMLVGGWKTPSVFARYNIIDENDLKRAAERLNEKRRRRIEAEAKRLEESRRATTKFEHSLSIVEQSETPVARSSRTM